MVMAERNFEEITRNGLRSQGPSPNMSDHSSAADDSDQEGGGMRVGGDYQAKIPEYNPSGKIDTKDAMLVWAPIPLLSDAKIDEYVSIAKEKHGYNTEQALGMLFWHKHNIDKALSDLANFTPFPDEWTVEDKVLFEQAFSFHGKNFHRIRQMLPDKSVSSLIKYYYTWKKTRSRTSVMDRHAKKLSTKEGVSDGSDEGSGESDTDAKPNGVAVDKLNKSVCTNCNGHTSQIHDTPKGSLCSPCFQYWRRTGLMRSAIVKKSDTMNRMKHVIMKHKRKPPRGMHLTPDDLAAMAKGPSGQSDAILKSLDSELVSLKRQVQANKQFISAQKQKTVSGIQGFRPPEPPQRFVARWTNDELLLAVQGVRKYGKDFRAIAEVIGNKMEVHVRSFFVSYRRRYNLDEVLAEYELEHGMVHERDEEDIKEEKMEVDSKPDQTCQPATIPDAPPPLTKQLDLPVTQKPIPPYARLLPPKPMVLQQPPPLIRPNTIPPVSEKSSA